MILAPPDRPSVVPSTIPRGCPVKQYVKGYAMFLAFALVTTLLVRPTAQKMNIPLLKDL